MARVWAGGVPPEASRHVAGPYGNPYMEQSERRAAEQHEAERRRRIEAKTL